MAATRTESRTARRIAATGAERALRRLHLTVSGVVLVAVAVAGWGLARWVGSRPLFLMVYAWALTMAVAWFVTRRRLAVEVDRSAIPARMREGQRIPVEMVVRANRTLATVIVEDQLPEALGAPVPLPLPRLVAGEEVEHRYVVTPRRRGVYRIGPATAHWTDPFGLTSHSQELAEPVEVIVHPRVEPVHDRVLTRMWEDPPIRPPVSKPWPTGFEFYGMRDYVPGDDLRQVVWSAVAKTGRMLVRESEQGITDRVAVVLDTDRRQHSPGDPSATFEAAVRTAASVGVHHLDDGFAVTLLRNGGGPTQPLRGSGAIYPLLDDLARVQMGAEPLSAVAPMLMADARRGTHVLLVTPHLDTDTTMTLRMVLDRGVSVTVVFVVWDETDPLAVNRAATLGCEVVQLRHDESLEAVFSHQVGAGIRR